jgi:hypothetical protein
LLKNRVPRKTAGLEKKEVKGMEENWVMSNFLTFIPPRNPVMVMKLKGRGNAADITEG